MGYETLIKIDLIMRSLQDDAVRSLDEATELSVSDWREANGDAQLVIEFFEWVTIELGAVVDGEVHGDSVAAYNLLLEKFP